MMIVSLLLSLSFLMKSILMLSSQRFELVSEVKRCINLLGLEGELHDLLNIGDHGKMVLALKSALRMKGQFRIAHDVEASASEVAHVLERCSVEPVATFERSAFLFSVCEVPCFQSVLCSRLREFARARVSSNSR